MLSAVWTDTIVEENNLNQNISVLRKIFGEKRGEHRFIATVPGQGYKFVAEVREIDGENVSEGNGEDFFVHDLPHSESDPPVKEVSEPANTGESEIDRKPAENNRSHRLWFGAIFLFAVLGLGFGWFYFSRPTAETSSADNDAIKTIAVLPFKPLVAGNRDETLEMGMVDSLISKLGGDQIVVRPLGSVRRFAGLEQDSLAAGRELETDAVLDGTIQTEGERIRISARLIRTSDGTQLWAGQFNEKFTGIFALQDSIAERAAAALKTRLEKRSKGETTNLEAYQNYLKGRFHFLKITRPETEKAVSYFEQAIKIDPNYALAYAGLADAYRGLAIAGELSPAEYLPKAKAAAQKAVELDGTLSDSHGVLDLLFSGSIGIGRNANVITDTRWN